MEAKLWMIENQFGRRDLNKFERAELALKAQPIIREIIREKAREKQILAGKNWLKTCPVFMRMLRIIEPCQFVMRKRLLDAKEAAEYFGNQCVYEQKKGR